MSGFFVPKTQTIGGGPQKAARPSGCRPGRYAVWAESFAQEKAFQKKPDACLAFSALKHKRSGAVRKKLPAYKDRRPELYTI